jgi:hypothetical protein
MGTLSWERLHPTGIQVETPHPLVLRKLARSYYCRATEFVIRSRHTHRPIRGDAVWLGRLALSYEGCRHFLVFGLWPFRRIGRLTGLDAILAEAELGPVET